MNNTLLPETLQALELKVARETGLDFSSSRNRDLEARNALAAKEFGFSDPETFARWVVSSLPAKRHEQWVETLTVGETYFRREAEVFETLEKQVIPALAANNTASRRLKIWCAGCSTGEEAYSLAISLARTKVDLKDWDVTILGTDMNTASLKKAEVGRYGLWAFRNTPSWFRDHYFMKLSNNVWEIRPELHRAVTFLPLNLIDLNHTQRFQRPDAPLLADFDLILCRNVLMYFAPDTASGVLQALKASLCKTGLLFVSASEFSLKGLDEFVSAPLGDTLAFRKSTSPAAAPKPVSAPAFVPKVRHQQKPRKASVLRRPLARPPKPVPKLDEVRQLADTGRWPEALNLCLRVLKERELDPSAHYLLAVLHIEMGHLKEAVLALQRALYLDPAHLLAHFSLGHLLQSQGFAKAAKKSFENALNVDRGAAAQVLPELDGLTVGQFRELVRQTLQEGDSL